MTSRLLVFLWVLGLAFAPLLPGQHWYRCVMDGRVHDTCCCPMATTCGHARHPGPAGCCTEISVPVPLAAAPAPPQIPAVQQLLVAMLVDIPRLAGVLCWQPRALCTAAPEPPGRAQRLFLRHCALLI